MTQSAARLQAVVDRNRQVAPSDRLNAIEAVEVLDGDGVPLELRQKVLFVHCLEPVPTLGTDNVAIEGGERVRGLRVLWARPAGHVAGSVAADDVAVQPHLPTGDRTTILVVRLEGPGDFSPYTLRIVAAADARAFHPSFDVRLHAASFSFKASCDLGLDCRHDPPCAAERHEEPALDHLAKDFAGFRRLMLDRMALTAPDRRDDDPADLAVTLVETLAYAADHLSYHQDAVAGEAYLATARLRTSVRRHARLLDYRLHDGCNARAWIAIQVDADGARVREPSPGAAGTRFLTRCKAATVVAGDREAEALAEGPEAFEAMADCSLYAAHSLIRFHTWDEPSACLASGATSATLADPGNALRLQPGDVLVFEEVRDPATGQPWGPDGGDPGRRHAVRLTSVAPAGAVVGQERQAPVRPPPGTDPHFDRVAGLPVVAVRWAVEDALPHEVVLAIVDDDGNTVADVSVARGNVVLADHGLTLPPAGLVVPATSGDDCPATFRPSLEDGALAHAEGLPQDRPGRRAPAARLSRQDPRRAVAAVAALEGRIAWAVRPDLLASGPFDRHFVVERDEGAPARLRFGDGVHGRQPTAGTTLKVWQRRGSGPAGNVGAGSIRHVVEPADAVGSFASIVSLGNPVPAAGGTGPEPLQRARLEAPHAFRRQERAVTVEDYAEAARRHPDVQRAVASRRWTGSWPTTFVTIDRRGGRPVDAWFEEEMRAFLAPLVLAGDDVEIAPPVPVPLDLAFEVCVRADAYRGAVQKALQEAFSSAERGDGRGLFHPDEWTFAMPVHLSRLVQHALRVPGVLSVKAGDEAKGRLRFRRWGHAPSDAWKAGVLPIGRQEIVRLDNDPNFPDHGRIVFHLEGGR